MSSRIRSASTGHRTARSPTTPTAAASNLRQPRESCTASGLMARAKPPSTARRSQRCPAGPKYRHGPWSLGSGEDGAMSSRRRRLRSSTGCHRRPRIAALTFSLRSIAQIRPRSSASNVNLPAGFRMPETRIAPALTHPARMKLEPYSAEIRLANLTSRHRQHPL